MTKPLLIAIALLLAGCGADHPEYDNMLLKNTSGQVYRLEWSTGNVYFVRPMDTLEMSKINKLTTTP